MQTQLDLRTATLPQLDKAREEQYYGLPPAGKKAQGVLALWAAGVGGVSIEETNKVILDPRVQMELKQTPVDGVGLAQEVRSASYSHGGRLADALNQPFEMLMFLSAINGG